MRGSSGNVIGTLAVHSDWQWARDVIARVRTEDARNAGVLVCIFDRELKVIHRPAKISAAEPLQPSSLASDVPVFLQ